MLEYSDLGDLEKVPKLDFPSSQKPITNFLNADSSVQKMGMNLLNKDSLNYIADRICERMAKQSERSSGSTIQSVSGGGLENASERKSAFCKNLASFLEKEPQYELISEGGIHIIRCSTCFTYIHDPVTSATQSRKPSIVQGSSLITGLVISDDDYKLYNDGGSQKWYNFKNRLLNHVTDASQTHANALRHARNMASVNERKMTVVRNQLRTAIGIVQSKSAAIHYETRIAELHNAGADVGDFGHSRVLFPQMIRVACSYIDQETQQFLSTDLPSTSLPPHFDVTADKSTNHRQSNQATLICPVIDGKRTGIPLGLSRVYTLSDGSGGCGNELAASIFSELKIHTKVQEMRLLSVQGKVTDGQYINVPFTHAMNEPIFEIIRKNCDEEDQKILLEDVWWECQWDPGHWLDKVFSKFHDSELITRLLGRVAMFHQLFHHGKMHSQLRLLQKN